VDIFSVVGDERTRLEESVMILEETEWRNGTHMETGSGGAGSERDVRGVFAYVALGICSSVDDEPARSEGDDASSSDRRTTCGDRASGRDWRERSATREPEAT